MSAHRREKMLDTALNGLVPDGRFAPVAVPPLWKVRPTGLDFEDDSLGAPDKTRPRALGGQATDNATARTNTPGQSVVASEIGPDLTRVSFFVITAGEEVFGDLRAHGMACWREKGEPRVGGGLLVGSRG